MGFEARSAVLEVLDEAIADTKAEVRVVAYDLSQPEIVKRLEKLGARLKVIIDDSGEHGSSTAPESKAAERLIASAGSANVKRQRMGGLQHNKTIVVQGPKTESGCLWIHQLHVARNLRAEQPCRCAARRYSGEVVPSSIRRLLGKRHRRHVRQNGVFRLERSQTRRYRREGDLQPARGKQGGAGLDRRGLARTKSSLFYSLAFLYQTPGAVVKALEKLQKDDKVFSFGVSDHDVGVLRLKNPNGLVRVVYPATLGKALPRPFKPEMSGGGGTRMHHKFVVIDFDQPSARVYFGSFNFSKAADGSNGENLTLVKDRRIATSFMIEAVRIYDHYAFRVARAEAKKEGKPLNLQRPPSEAGEKPWWDRFYTNAAKIKDRETFA